MNFITRYFRSPSITFGITVCNEAAELDLLLKQLILQIQHKDEIVVLQDVTNRNVEVGKILKKYSEKIKVVESQLNGDFASFKNKLLENSSKDFLFQIDADEQLQQQMVSRLRKKLKNHPKFDVFLIPRINTVEGITDEHLKEWNWTKNTAGYLNFPDLQQRIFKNNGKIFWKNKVHEELYGFEKVFILPSDTENFCLIHKKNISKQEIQNSFYDKL